MPNTTDIVVTLKVTSGEAIPVITKALVNELSSWFGGIGESDWQETHGISIEEIEVQAVMGF